MDMEALITSFRRGRHHTYPNQVILSVESVTSREAAEKLVGKAVTWTSPGKLKKIIKGKVSSAHGNSGALRAIFESGMPGQSLGSKVPLN
jgi:large subunit ribosomal protein L35Ae